MTARLTSTMTIVIILFCWYSFAFASIQESSLPELHEWKLFYHTKFNHDSVKVLQLRERLRHLSNSSTKWKIPVSDSDLTETLRIAWAAETPEFDVYDLASLILAESRYRKNGVSRKGAKGLTQIIPRYWTEVLGKNFNAFDKQQNILGGAKILQKLHRSSRSKTEVYAKYNGGIAPPASAYEYSRTLIRLSKYLRGETNHIPT